MIKPPDVADLGDQADGRDKRDPAQRLHRVDDRRPAPRGRELTQLVGEALDAPLRFVDRVAILLQCDVLRRQRETEIGEPAAIGLGPSGTPGIPAALPQQERFQPMLRLRTQPNRIFAGAHEVA